MTEKEGQFDHRVDGIHFLLIGGKPGSGLRAIGREIHERLADQGFAVAIVAGNDFHEPTRDCAVCAQRKVEKPCSCCPESTLLKSLINTIEKVSKALSESQTFIDKGSGFIILQGHYVMCHKALVDQMWHGVWIHEDDVQCLARVLKALGQVSPTT